MGKGGVIVGVLVVRVEDGVWDLGVFVPVFVTDSSTVIVGVGDVTVSVKDWLIEYVPVHERVHVGEMAQLSECVDEGVERENCEMEAVIVLEKALTESVFELMVLLS